MKNISRIDFNPDRRMTNVELLSLRGGNEPGGGMNCCMCHLSDGTEKGYMLSATIGNCVSLCAAAYFGGYGTWECLV